MAEQFKILIVDDERSNLLTLDKILKSEYEVFVAINGKTALKITSKIIPDLILLDVIMPDISGFEVLSELKSNELTRRIPVVFITGLDNIEDEEKGFALGAADYITKPFHAAIVKARVKMQLQMVEYIRTIEQLSMIDMLTQMLNRRGFDERITNEWNRAAREKQPLGILIIDIDKFKDFNDENGHLIGDSCLRVISDSIKNSLNRATDIAARWGGEEFVILLPNTDLQGALVIAEKVRTNVELDTVAEMDHCITVSVGVNAVIPCNDIAINDFISKADEALYDAKNSGRNKVCFIKPE